MFPTSVTAWSKLVSFLAGLFTRMRTVCSVFFDFSCVRHGGQVGGVWGEFVRLGEHRDFPLSIFKNTIIAAMIVVV